jgi:hypothetical protein
VELEVGERRKVRRWIYDGNKKIQRPDVDNEMRGQCNTFLQPHLTRY